MSGETHTEGADLCLKVGKAEGSGDSKRKRAQKNEEAREEMK